MELCIYLIPNVLQMSDFGLRKLGLYRQYTPTFMPVNSQKGGTFLRESPKVQKCVKEIDYLGKKCLSADFNDWQMMK